LFHHAMDFLFSALIAFNDILIVLNDFSSDKSHFSWSFSFLFFFWIVNIFLNRYLLKTSVVSALSSMALIPRYEDVSAIWSSHSKALIVYMDASFLYDSFLLILFYFDLWQTLDLRVFTRFCFGPYNFFSWV